jgi:hypothetical protein
MHDLVFKSVTDAESKAFLEEVAGALSPLEVPAATTKVSVAELSFYEDFKLYALENTQLPPPNVHYVLYKPGDVNLLNWTNEPIYSVNERAKMKLDRKTLVSYSKFFFHFVRGQLGRFIIVEKPEEVTWLDSAKAKEKEDVKGHLVPVTYKGIGRDNLFTLTCVVVFKNALFKTDIKVAPYEMDVPDAEVGGMEHYTIGQMKLTNEELLLEELNIPVDPPPGEFG